jgi:hypothetical protein
MRQYDNSSFGRFTQPKQGRTHAGTPITVVIRPKLLIAQENGQTALEGNTRVTMIILH